MRPNDRRPAPAKLVLAICLILTLGSAVLAADERLDRATIGRAVLLSSFGERALSHDRPELAQRRFEEALRLVPDLPSAQLGLGHLAMRASHHERALARYRSARDGWLRLSRRISGTRHWVELSRLARANIEIQELRDAIEQLRSEAENPGFESLSLERSELENELRRVEGLTGPQADEGTGEIAPGETYFYIGNALFQLGRVREAVEAWETCVERSPRFPPVYMNLALGYRTLGSLPRAHRAMRKLQSLSAELTPEMREAFLPPE